MTNIQKGNYECFSRPMMQFILKNRVMPISIDIHRGTGRTMWTYESTDELSQLLGEWTKRKRG